MSIFDTIKDYFKDYYKDIPEVKPNKVKEQELEPKQITFAKDYHGKHEVEDNAQLKALLGIDPAKTAWCAAFVNVIERKCGRKGTGKLAARSFLTYGDEVSTPQLGDIVIFKRGKLPWQGHVGYYMSQDKNGILVLGGNQSNKVCYKYYAKDALLGFRRP